MLKACPPIPHTRSSRILPHFFLCRPDKTSRFFRKYTVCHAPSLFITALHFIYSDLFYSFAAISFSEIPLIFSVKYPLFVPKILVQMRLFRLHLFLYSYACGCAGKKNSSPVPGCLFCVFLSKYGKISFSGAPDPSAAPCIDKPAARFYFSSARIPLRAIKNTPLAGEAYSVSIIFLFRPKPRACVLSCP